MLSRFSRVSLSPYVASLPGSCVHGILQARILEWVAMPFSRDLPDPEVEPSCLKSPALEGGFFTTSATWEDPSPTERLTNWWVYVCVLNGDR